MAKEKESRPIINEHVKLLKQVREDVYIKKIVFYGKQVLKVEIKNEPSVFCETDEFARHIMREARLDAAYRIMKKPRNREIKLKL